MKTRARISAKDAFLTVSSATLGPTFWELKTYWSIDFPGVIEPNIVVCLTQEAYSTYAPEIRPGGILLADSRFVKTTRKVDARQIELPMYETVMAEIGKPIVFNICVLGALIGLADLVRPESALKAVRGRVPADYVEMNTRAFQLGFELGLPLRR